MIGNFFGSVQAKIVHCEMTGEQSSLDSTKILTRISGVINLNLFRNAQVDHEGKMIYPVGRPPLRFFCKVHVPSDLKFLLGELYATVDDYDEPEQSTNILSERGTDIFMGKQLFKLAEHLKEYEIINFPESMFFVSVSNAEEFQPKVKQCNNWDVPYHSIGKKYRFKKVLEEKSSKSEFGVPAILWPGYDVGFSDCSDKNPIGTGYLLKTDKNFISIDICSNESAVDYCKKNNVLVYYNDFMNSGKLRVLSKHTESINTNLKNDYKYRSLFI